MAESLVEQREQLVGEARGLADQAGEGSLSGDASARFAAIEQQVNSIDDRLAQQGAMPGAVEQSAGVPAPSGREFNVSRRDPFAEFGMRDRPAPLSPSRDQMVNLFNAASRRESVRFSTVDT